MYSSPQTFDPADSESVPNSQMLQQVFEGLVQYDANNKVVSCLAQSWDISPDGKTYTFHLRPGVRFQNGQPLTADDVAYSLSRALDPALKSQVAPEYMQDIVGAKDVIAGKTLTLSGVHVINPQTVSVAITSPKAYWVDTLTYPTGFIVCKSVVGKLGHRPLTDADVVQGIGTGPFRLARYVKDSDVEMDANKSYWGGPPTLAGVTFRIITDPTTRHAEFVSGELDVMRQEEFGNYANDKKDPNLQSRLHAWPRAGLYYLALNENAYAPFKDARVRQAFAYAVDKQTVAPAQTLSDRATAGVYPPAQDFLPPGVPGSDPNFQGLPYDPAKAKALLAEAGYPGGKGLPPLEIYTYTQRPFADNAADLMRQMFGAVGIPAKVHQMEFGALIAAIDANNQIPCFLFGWYADYLDPQDFDSLLFSSASPENHTGYKNPQLDALCARADIEPNPAKRMALYRQASQIIRDDAPRIPLFYASDPELVQPYVHDLGDCLMGHLPHNHVRLH